MALHSRDAVTVSAAVATRSRADCNSMEGHTSLSTALDIILFRWIYPPKFIIEYCPVQESQGLNSVWICLNTSFITVQEVLEILGKYIFPCIMFASVHIVLFKRISFYFTFSR